MPVDLFNLTFVEKMKPRKGDIYSSSVTVWRTQFVVSLQHDEDIFVRYPNYEQLYQNKEQFYPDKEQLYPNNEQLYPKIEQPYPNNEQLTH